MRSLRKIAFSFFFQAEDGIRDYKVTGVQTCALPIFTIDQTGQSGAQPSLYIVGGYTFGRTGVNDVIKYVNGTTGTTPYISVNNFYVQDYVNAVNDVVNGRTTAAANMKKLH